MAVGIKRIEIRLLGRFATRRGGQEIPPGEFGGRLARTLVRVLATRRGRFVARDVLAESLWPTKLPADPGANLKVLVNRARRALGDPALIVTDPGGYSLVDDDRCLVDAEVFTAKVEAGRDRLRAGQADAAFREFQAGLELWRGEPLEEDAYDDWAQEYRARVQRAHQEALEGAASAALVLGDPGQAAALAELAVAREPLREPAYLLLMRAHAAGGDTATALATFQALRWRLADDLGLDPSPEAFELEGRILRGEPLTRALGRPALRSPARPSRQLAFVGRDDELEAISELGAGPAAGPVVVAGSAGTGKSRLLEEAAVQTRSPAATARAFLPEREEAWGLARPLLREILEVAPDVCQALPERAVQAVADLVPELAELAPVGSQALDPETRRALAVEGSVRLLAAALSQRVLVLVDDLQWADPTSLAVLRQALGRASGRGMVLAYRPEDVSGLLASFLDDLDALTPRPRRLLLGPLPAVAVRGLFVDPGLAEAIVAETDLTPFAVAEVVKALADERLIEPDADGRWRPRSPDAVATARALVRAGQMRAVAARVAQHPPSRRLLLSLLALLGRETPARVLSSVTGVAQGPTLDGLETLARAALVRLGDEGWALAHDRISATVTQDLDPVETGRLHQLLAGALTTEGAEPSLVARHLEGAGDLHGAARLFAEAAGLRLSRFETDEAERLAEAGLRLPSPPALSSQLLETRAEARARRGDVAGARADLRAALASKPAGPERARVLARLAKLTGAAEGFERAAQLVDVALAEAGDDRASRAQAQAVGAFVDLNLNRLERAEERSAEALGLFEEIGDGRGVLEIIDFRASFALISVRLEEYVAAADEAVPLFKDVGDLLRAASLQGYRGLALAWLGRGQQGLSDIEEALELVRSLGDREGEARCLWLRGEVLAVVGRATAAFESAEAAVRLAREVGHRGTLGMCLFGLGLACELLGDLDRAEAAYRESLREGAHAPMVLAAAAGRLASVLTSRGEYEAAAGYTAQGLCGPPIVRHEVGLIQARLALARGDPRAPEVAAEALAAADVLGARSTAAYLQLRAAVAACGQPQAAGRPAPGRATTLS